MLDPENVAAWLTAHPEFFMTHGALLDDVQLPHPHGTHAVSLTERQVQTLRDKNRTLEQRLSKLIQHAEANDIIGSQVHRLALRLLDCDSLESLIDGLIDQFQNGFGVPQVTLRLWNLNPSPSFSHTAFTPIDDTQRHTLSVLKVPYCGDHGLASCDRWFDDRDREGLRSFALVPLRDTETFGLLLLASTDPKRFSSDLGVDYLQHMAELTSAALRAALRRGHC